MLFMRLHLRRFLSSSCFFEKVRKNTHTHVCGAERRPPHQPESPSSENPAELLSSEHTLESPTSRSADRSRRTPRVLQSSRRASGTLRPETESSEQTLRDRRVLKRAAAGRRASTAITANTSEDKHSWDRVPAWDGDKRQRKRYLRDAELDLETEKLDVDFSHGIAIELQESTLRPSSLTKFVAQRVLRE